MKTDVDSALKDIAGFYLTNRRSMTEPELEAILLKHCESEAEVTKFVSFLGTDPGQLRFKTHLRERKPSTLTERKAEVIPTAIAKAIEGKTINDITIKKVGDTWWATVTDTGFPIVGLLSRKETETYVAEIFKTKSASVSREYDIPLAQKFRGEMMAPSYLKESEEEVTEFIAAFDRSYAKAFAGIPGAPLTHSIGLRGIAKELGMDFNSPAFKSRVEEMVKEGTLKFAPDREAKENLLIRMPGLLHEQSIGLVAKRPVASYLKEATAVAETECQLISPQYYDILTWFNIPVPDYSFAIEPEVRERKIDEVLQKLKDGVSRIHESSLFREFLTTMAKFWEYSFGNQILIMLQRPGATRVAGFVTWKEFGRHVKFGEKGIAILAPCLPPKALVCPLCGNPFTERELRTHLSEVHRREDISALVREAREGAVAVPTPTYFKVVNVFDVSQTEGKPLPEIAVPVLSGAFSKELYDKLMTLASKHSLTVSFEPRPEQDPQIKGMLLGKDIWVKGDEPEAQRLKTLGHELAHYFTEAVYLIPRADAEVIAESVSFVVCAHSGFDTGTRSFPYVALWAKEKKVLEQNLASIRKISGRMIEELG